jgi:hypothetical protein
MVQIVEHRAETLEDFLVEEEAATFTPRVPNRLVLGATAMHAAQQHTTAQTSWTPSRAASGALVSWGGLEPCSRLAWSRTVSLHTPPHCDGCPSI